jgi:hypothetical protein
MSQNYTNQVNNIYAYLFQNNWIKMSQTGELRSTEPFYIYKKEYIVRLAMDNFDGTTNPDPDSFNCNMEIIFENTSYHIVYYDAISVINHLTSLNL